MRITLMVLCLLLAGCSGKSANPRVRIATSSTGLHMGWLPITLAEVLGYYKEEGLDVELQNLPSAAKALQALIGGSIDVAGLTYGQTIQMAAEGQKIKSIFVFNQRDNKALIVAPAANGKIKRVEDLKSAVIGVPSPGSPANQWLNYFLAAHHVNPANVSFVGIGTAGSAFAAVESGRVDAAVFSGGEHLHLLRRHPDMRMLVDASTAEGMRATYGDGVYAGAAAAAKQQWLDQNPESARKLTSALVRTLQWIAAHKPEEIRERLPENFRSSDGAVDLDIIRLGMEAYTADGAMPKSAPETMRRYLDATLEKMREAKIDLAATWTNEYLPERK